MRKIYLLLLTGLFLSISCKKNGKEKDKESNEEPGKIQPVTSPDGDVVGKVTIGYQGWFSAAGDGSPMNYWSHQNLEHWPDVRQYTHTYAGSPFFQAGIQQANFYGNLGNGLPAGMFSSDDQQVSDTHCRWMKQNGIDCIALQRFGSYTSPGQIKDFHDEVDLKMKNSAEKYGLKFYIMYDCKATDPVTTDWTNTIISLQHLTSSSSYAKQNGKPVVCLWGIGSSGRGTTSDWVNTINWFKNNGCYVIGGPLSGFANDTANQPAYEACNMIMAWMVGKTAASNWPKLYRDDLVYCNARGIDYQADVYPGTSFYNSDGTWVKNKIPRNHGDFMWSQFTGAKNAEVRSLYISMFDEMNEGTGILNCAEDEESVPAGNYFLTLDADGTKVSSDFYLRLVNDGIKMFKAQIPFTTTHPTPHMLTFPSNVSLNVLSGSSIKIDWQVADGAPCYNVKRAADSGGPYTVVASEIEENSYTDTHLAAGTTYYYIITSGRINAGESGNSLPVSAKTGN